MVKPEGILFKKSTDVHVLQDVKEPNLLRDLFPYSSIPRITFDGTSVEMNPPRKIWLTDTTFRDGQQAMEPFTVKQIVNIYKLMHKLNGSSDLIRQTEYFLYSDKDKKAVEKCLELGYRYPEVTGWIRAVKKDFKLVKAMGLKETGILTSCSDYHIFLKLKKNRRECMEGYLDVVRTAISAGIRPRCHFEDVTRADVYGFVVPFAIELMKLREDSGIPVKIRLCDTMGYGVPYPEATLPRSVPKLVHALVQDAGVPSELLEWHGHNDFHRVAVNSTTCWLYGCSAINGALFGLGERTGNCPIETAVLDYIALTGSNAGLNTKVITELADYFKTHVNYKFSANMPLVGSNFNVTSAGIHVDGILKNEEIYNIFDTRAILGRPAGVLVTNSSGVAGVTHWVNEYLNLETRSRIPKSHPAISEIYKWINKQYEKGRVHSISNQEMLRQAELHLPEYFDTDLNDLKRNAISLVDDLILSLSQEPAMVKMQKARQEALMAKTIAKNSYINLMLVADTRGAKQTRFVGREGPIKPRDEALLDKDYTDRRWFRKPLEIGKLFVSDLFVSKITNRLGMTVSAPILKDDGQDAGVLRIDVRFEDLLKLARAPHDERPGETMKKAAARKKKSTKSEKSYGASGKNTKKKKK